MTRSLTHDEVAAAASGMTASWWDDAACTGRATLLDPPEYGQDHDSVREALRVCWACPVMWLCRAWVLGLPEAADPDGVCGGLTEGQRAQLRRRARRRAGTP